jgi:2-polyprenyl-3-methyl-5-hydroxy-6-metoxy-1,4-benzoquinol methylase
MRVIRAHNLLEGRKLDYGCGRGTDADIIGMEKYDPHWAPELPKGKFQTVTCIYVLNVIEAPEERKRVEDQIIQLLAPGGRALIAVRDDVLTDGQTTKGWQGMVEPTDRWRKIVHSKGNYRIYEHVAGKPRTHGCKTCVA